MSKRSEKGYQLYKSLGKERTYTKVAELMGLSIKTVETWGYKEKWQEKINEEYEKKAEELQNKREELELKGFEVALAVMDVLSEKIKGGKITKEMAQIYETFLTCPLSVVDKGETVKEQSAGATSNTNDKEKIEIVFDMNGGVSSED